MSENIVNARITSIQWVMQPCLSNWIYLEGDGWGAGFGGYCLNGEYCSIWITSIMKILDVEEFNDKTLIGKIIRAKSQGWGGRVTSIGHPIKDLWFDPEKVFKELKNG